jgi:hypothetical protein
MGPTGAARQKPTIRPLTNKLIEISGARASVRELSPPACLGSSR